MATVNITELEQNLTAYAESNDNTGAVLDALKVTLSPLVVNGAVNKESAEYLKVRDIAARTLQAAFFRKPRKGVDMDAARQGVDADDKAVREWTKDDPRKIGRSACLAYARRAWQVVVTNCLPSSDTASSGSSGSKGGKANTAKQADAAPPMTPEVLLGAVDALIVTLSVEAGRAFLNALRTNCKAYGTYLDAGKPVPKPV